MWIMAHHAAAGRKRPVHILFVQFEFVTPVTELFGGATRVLLGRWWQASHILAAYGPCSVWETMESGRCASGHGGRLRDLFGFWIRNASKRKLRIPYPDMDLQLFNVRAANTDTHQWNPSFHRTIR